jgi:hypothetical protein
LLSFFYSSYFPFPILVIFLLPEFLFHVPSAVSFSWEYWLRHLIPHSNNQNFRQQLFRRYMSIRVYNTRKTVNNGKGTGEMIQWLEDICLFIYSSPSSSIEVRNTWIHTSIPPFNRSPFYTLVSEGCRGGSHSRSVAPSLLQPHVSHYFSGCRTHLHSLCKCWTDWWGRLKEFVWAPVVARRGNCNSTMPSGRNR